MIFLPFSSTPLLLSGLTSGLGKTSAMQNEGGRLCFEDFLYCVEIVLAFEHPDRKTQRQTIACGETPLELQLQGRVWGTDRKGRRMEISLTNP